MYFEPVTCKVLFTVFRGTISSINLLYRNVNDVHEQWFADEGRVRKSVGLFEKPVVQYLNAREVSIRFLTLHSA